MNLTINELQHKFIEKFPKLAQYPHLTQWVARENKQDLESFFSQLLINQKIHFIKKIFELNEESFNKICNLASLPISRDVLSQNKVPLIASLEISQELRYEANFVSLAYYLLSECLLNRFQRIVLNSDGESMNEKASDLFIEEFKIICLPNNWALFLNSPIHQYLSDRLVMDDINDVQRYFIANRLLKRSSNNVSLIKSLCLDASLINNFMGQEAMDEAMRYAFENLDTALLTTLLTKNNISKNNAYKNLETELNHIKKREWISHAELELIKLFIGFAQAWEKATKWKQKDFKDFTYSTLIFEEEIRGFSELDGRPELEVEATQKRLKWSDSNEVFSKSVLIGFKGKIKEYVQPRCNTNYEYNELYNSYERDIKKSLNVTCNKINDLLKKEALTRKKLVDILNGMRTRKEAAFNMAENKCKETANKLIKIEKSLLDEKNKAINQYFMTKDAVSEKANNKLINKFSYKKQFIKTLYENGFTIDFNKRFFLWTTEHKNILEVTPIEWFILNYFPQKKSMLKDEHRDDFYPIENYSQDYLPFHGDEKSREIAEFAICLAQEGKVDLRHSQVEENSQYIVITASVDNQYSSMNHDIYASQSKKHENHMVNTFPEPYNSLWKIHQNKLNNNWMSENQESYPGSTTSQPYHLINRDLPHVPFLEALQSIGENKKDSRTLPLFSFEEELAYEIFKLPHGNVDILSILLRTNDVDFICRVVNHFDINFTIEELNEPDSQYYNWTLLHKSIFSLHMPFCKKLIRLGASLAAKDVYEQTPGGLLIKVLRLVEEFQSQIISPDQGGNILQNRDVNLLSKEEQCLLTSLTKAMTSLMNLYNYMLEIITNKNLQRTRNGEDVGYGDRLEASAYLEDMHIYLEMLKAQIQNSVPTWWQKIIWSSSLIRENENFMMQYKKLYEVLRDGVNNALISREGTYSVYKVDRYLPDSNSWDPRVRDPLKHIVVASDKALGDVTYSCGSYSRRIMKEQAERERAENERKEKEEREAEQKRKEEEKKDKVRDEEYRKKIEALEKEKEKLRKAKEELSGRSITDNFHSYFNRSNSSSITISSDSDSDSDIDSYNAGKKYYRKDQS